MNLFRISLIVFFTCLIVISCGNGKHKTSNGMSAPFSPENIHVMPGDSKVTLSWSQINTAVDYNLYMAIEPGITPSNFTSLVGGMVHEGIKNPYVHTSLTNGLTYYFIVTASNEYGESGSTEEVSAIPMKKK